MLLLHFMQSMQRALSSVLNHLQLIKKLGTEQDREEAARIEAVLQDNFMQAPEAVNFATAEEDANTEDKK